MQRLAHILRYEHGVGVVRARIEDEYGVQYGNDYYYKGNDLTEHEMEWLLNRDAADKLWPMAFSERKFSD